MKSLWNYRYWCIAPIVIILGVVGITYQQHHAANEYKRHRANYCSANFASMQQKESCIEEKTDAQDYLPWGYGVANWPSGIEAWAIILTGFFIGSQAWETRKAAEASLKSAKATEDAAEATKSSVEVARRQIAMVKNKERARVEIIGESLTLDDEHMPYWNFFGKLKTRNLGPSRAYINMFQAEIVWHKTGEAVPSPNFGITGNMLTDSYIDPTDDWNENEPVRVGFYQTDSINLDWFSTAVYEGNVEILIRGAIEYETVGTVYTRYFCFEWRASGRPNSFARLFMTAPPTTNATKLSSGFWGSTLDTEEEKNNPENPN